MCAVNIPCAVCDVNVWNGAAAIAVDVENGAWAGPLSVVKPASPRCGGCLLICSVCDAFESP